jgi:hypothetical protein
MVILRIFDMPVIIFVLARKGFYVYTSLLAILDLVQSIGAGLLNYTQNPAGLCVVDLTAIMYLTLFTPLVYHTFLTEFLGYVKVF